MQKIYLKITDGYVTDMVTKNPHLENYIEAEVESCPVDIMNQCYRFENGSFILDENRKYFFDAQQKAAKELGEDYVPNSYETLVLIGIREKYSLQQEQALARQKDSKPEKWEEYYDYCEECKKKAKEQLGIPRTLKDAKKEKKRQIERYDNSEAVNSFLVNGMPTWILGERRSQYMTSIASARIMEESTIELPILGRMIALPLDNAERMLAQLQRYGDNAANCTDQHYMNVDMISSIEEVDGYDYTTGYPEKVSFEIEL